MILLLGGTSETKGIALGLAASSVRVIVSTATDNELDVGTHPNIERRRGRLDEAGMEMLIREKEVTLLVDASHPFAIAAHETARLAAERCGIRYLRFERPSEEYGYKELVMASGHEEAAKTAFSYGKPVLLTTGSRNLAQYAAISKKTGIPLVARVLPHDESLKACDDAGLPRASVITGRGPFSVEENIASLRRFGIGVLVSKESGEAGGVKEKIEAARQCGCAVVIVKRPMADPSSFDDINVLLEQIKRA